MYAFWKKGEVPSASSRINIWLDVSFRQKNKAAELGARWDAEEKRWYVPHGLDIMLFRKWWPKELKEQYREYEVKEGTAQPKRERQPRKPRKPRKREIQRGLKLATNIGQPGNDLI